MAKKAKQAKLNFKPTPISRLRHYTSPLKMVGDPPHNGSWQSRERLVYDYEMDRKRLDDRGWLNATYYAAERDNARIDHLLKYKWDRYHEAYEDNRLLDHEQAILDNAAWDYEHDNFVGSEVS